MFGPICSVFWLAVFWGFLSLSFCRDDRDGLSNGCAVGRQSRCWFTLGRLRFAEGLVMLMTTRCACDNSSGEAMKVVTRIWPLTRLKLSVRNISLSIDLLATVVSGCSSVIRNSEEFYKDIPRRRINWREYLTD